MNKKVRKFNKITCKSQNGFTLIEITVVIMVIVLIAGITIPRLGDLLTFSLKSASRKMVSSIRDFYSEAVIKRRDFYLNFNLDNDEYWWSEEKDGLKDNDSDLIPWLKVYDVSNEKRNSFMDEDEEIMKRLERRRLPNGIYFRDIIIPSEGKIEEGEVKVSFKRFGLNDPITIHLIDKKEREYTLFVNPVGIVKVLSGYEERR